MKVLMVSKACVVGAYQRKLEEIAALGVDLTVIVPPRWEDERGCLMLERKYTSGYRLVESPLRFNGHFHLHYYPQLRRWLQSTRPDIVHVDEEPGDFVAFHAIRNAVHAGARPLFFSWQNLMREYPPPFRWFTQYAFNHCSHAIAGNADAERVLRAKGYRGIIRLIPQFGVDPEIFKPVVRQETDRKRPFTLAYAGRMTAVKGVDILLRAAAGITRDWRLRLIGNGPERDNLRRLAHRSWTSPTRSPSNPSSVRRRCRASTVRLTSTCCPRAALPTGSNSSDACSSKRWRAGCPSSARPPAKFQIRSATPA